MPFDFNALMQNPNFQMGIGILGAASPKNRPLLDAYQIMQQAEQHKQKGEEQKAMMEYRRAQAEVSRQTAAKYGEQIDLMRQQQNREAETRKQFDPIMQDMLRRYRGGQAAQPQPAQPQVPQLGQEIAPTPPPTEVGKYGTPKIILQNLAQVESGGNPLAIGPDIGGGKRAKGKYQFLDDTVAMLRKQGIDFDPFKPQQAEDAADFYLQQLVTQHGGDYQKALAAYGGFKTKDSSSYVSRVLQGSPEAQAKQQMQIQAQQASQQKNQQIFGQDEQLATDLQVAGGMAKYLGKDMGGGLTDIGKALERPGELARKERGVTAEEGRLRVQQEELTLKKQAAPVERQQKEADITKKKQEIAQEKTKVSQAIQNHEALMDRLATTANQLRKSPGLNRITGKVGSFIEPRLLGDEAMNAAAILETLNAQTFVQGTLAIRQASPTGAGVGNQSNEEGNKLQAAIAKLTRAQTYASMVDALKDVEELAEGSKQRMRKAYEIGYGENAPIPPAAELKQIGTKDGRPVYQLPDGSKVW